MSDAFEAWWEAYPSAPKRPKVAKQYCRDMWKRRNLDAIADQVMAALAYHKDHIWDMKQPQYIPMTRTWLHQGRYEIDIPEQPQPRKLTEQEILKLASR